MKWITAAQLRQSLRATLDDVQAGQTYVVTRHGHAIAQLRPVGTSGADVIPAKAPGGSQLSQRPRRKTYEEAKATLSDVRAQSSPPTSERRRSPGSLGINGRKD